MAKSKQTEVLPLEQNAPRLSGTVQEINERKDTEAHEMQEFFLPVSGFIWYYPQEVAVINHPAFQRLAKINQLGQAHLVFRGATHKRIEHVLGAVGVAQKMIEAVKFNSEQARSRQEAEKVSRTDQDWRAPLDIAEQRFVRLGALLHDIGHLAAGHTLEDELGLFGKHDEDERLDYLFGDHKELGGHAWEGAAGVPTLARLIDDNYKRWLPDDLELDDPITASRLVRLLIRKPPKDPADDEYRHQHDALVKSSQIRAAVCTNMIGNTICADLLDYISRDWYHVGKPIRPDDRIFQYMEIRNPDKQPQDIVEGKIGRRHCSDKFVLALGGNEGRAPKIRTDGVSAILSLLERRYELGETVLYHRTKLAAGAMLGRAMFELWAGEKPWPQLLDRSDEQLIDYTISEARRRRGDWRKQLKANELPEKERQEIEARIKRSETAEELLVRLRARKLYKAFYTERHWSITSTQKQKLTQLFAPDGDDKSSGAKARTYAASLLEETFELPLGSVVVSLANVRPKIAEVEIRVNDKITQFNEFEQACDESDRPGLSGGHLKAQVKRFGDLWRLDFFMEQKLHNDLKNSRNGVLELMKDAIDQIFVNPPADSAALIRAAERIYQTYSRLDIKVAAKSDAPSKPRTLASLWSPEAYR
jgi:HD superfamily phosphohydrolase